MVSALGPLIPRYNCSYKRARTLLHGDYRLDNLMFGGPYPHAVVDWQTVTLGCALRDVAYLAGSSLDPALRAANERALIAHYFEVLASYGVDLTCDECWHFYRHYAPAALILVVVTASMLMTVAERSCKMITSSGP